MTATIKTINPTAPPRRRFRLASMEALGFIDNPGTASTWTTTAAHPTTVVTSTTSQIAPTIDPFADWQPTEVGSRLLYGRVRWGLLSTLLLMAVGLVGIGFYIHQRPAALASETLIEVHASASALSPELIAAQELNNGLLDQEPMSSTVTASLLTLASKARDLFEASATLPPSKAASRTLAANVASEALDASRLLGTSYAYRAAVIPILAAPEFETDAGLIALDDAARRFGEWQLKFDSVRSALPAGTLSSVTNELAIISGDLQSVQTRYLDALRRADRPGAVTAVDNLSKRLTAAEGMLYSGLSEVQVKVQSRIDKALSTIELLVR
ncbi:MAG: hypothetical protein O7C01_06820 [Actinobacteria bacterium]|nr:hypothetical protein [Actinomycetota bacterium]